MKILEKKVKKILNKDFLEIKDAKLKKLFELDMPYPYNMKFGQLINMETQIVLISMTLKNTDSQKELIKSINNECVNVRKNKELPFTSEILGIRNLTDKQQYNQVTGLNIKYKIQSFFIL